MADTEDRVGSHPEAPAELHTDRPHAARVYGVLLGGKTDCPADRVAAEQALTALPSAATTARRDRHRHPALRGPRTQELTVGS